MPAACPYCEWSDQQYRLPAHILSRHIEHIRIGDVQRDHCLNAFVRPDGGLLEFSVCLTCKKGTVADITEGNGQRWVSIHSKKAACRSAHAAAYSAFKDRWVAAKAAVAPSAEDPTPPPPPVNTSIATLWDECKSNKRMAPMVEEIEAKVLEDAEAFEDEPCFTPEEGFKQAIYSAIGYSKRVVVKQQEMDDLVIAHDKEIRELTSIVRDQDRRVRWLMSNKRDLDIEIEGFRSENSQLRKDVDNLQQENSQIRKDLDGVRLENSSFQEELAQLREQIATMRQEFDAYKKAHPV